VLVCGPAELNRVRKPPLAEGSCVRPVERVPMEATAWWADMRRGNDLLISGLRVLRFPAFVVRDQPGVVAAQIREALGGRRVAVP
jgi:hypothetical protein